MYSLELLEELMIAMVGCMLDTLIASDCAMRTLVLHVRTIQTQPITQYSPRGQET